MHRVLNTVVVLNPFQCVWLLCTKLPSGGKSECGELTAGKAGLLHVRVDKVLPVASATGGSPCVRGSLPPRTAPPWAQGLS